MMRNANQLTHFTLARFSNSSYLIMYTTSNLQYNFVSLVLFMVAVRKRCTVLFYFWLYLQKKKKIYVGFVLLTTTSKSLRTD